MVLKVKTDFAVIVGATGKNSTTTGKVHVHYASNGGVQITGDGGDSNATGNGDTSYADEAITQTARTGKIGDGKIFVMEIERAVRIRTGETDSEAL